MYALPELESSLARARNAVVAAIWRHPPWWQARHWQDAQWHWDTWRTALELGDLDGAAAERERLRRWCVTWREYDYSLLPPHEEPVAGETSQDHWRRTCLADEDRRREWCDGSLWWNEGLKKPG